MRTHSDLTHALTAAREQTDDLFRIVRPDSWYERPIPERHRMIFYLGHLEAFDWNLMGRYQLNLPSLHPSFDRLFAFGIDPPPGQLPADQPSEWPAIEEVRAYNQRTRERIDQSLAQVPDQLMHVAIEHRLMHAETFAYILHNLAYERKHKPALTPAPNPATPPQSAMIDIPAGAARLGLDRDQGFGWDNAFEAHTLDVPAFSVARYKVTNREYLDFVRSGAAAPFFWTERNGNWFYRGMFEETPLPLDSPVYVTLREAEAYARSRGMSILTEPQFHRAACVPPAAGNFDFRHWDPIPVHAGDSPARTAPAQMFGNGWEWTSTPFAPLPHFRPFPFYENYSEPFFDGEHYVLKGASPRTAACMVRASFRNWFRPAYPYIYATFRLVQS